MNAWRLGHWGATTQNITQTGDVLVLRKVHRVILLFLGLIMTALADLAERSAQMVMAGRTHGQQHAVPVTFGLKVASWIDELGRQVSRLRELEPRLFVAVVGGAAGTFASMGARASEVQNGVAKRLGLVPACRSPRAVWLTILPNSPARSDCWVRRAAKSAEEIYILMKTEYGEVEEPVPAGTVGSSTMPQKRNPNLPGHPRYRSGNSRALAPLARGCAKRTRGRPFARHGFLKRSDEARSSSRTPRAHPSGAAGLRLNPQRIRSNLDLSGGTISAEAIMLELRKAIGRQHAHDVVYEAAQAARSENVSFPDRLAADPRVSTNV